jgi:cobalamin biosynthesis protein CobT
MEVRGCRPEGNNKPAYNDDGPCLLECAELLRAEPASDRLLIVVSDGRPAGRRSNESDLRDAVAQLTSNDKEMELLALGLGPGTSHVSEYYPAAEADVPLAEFAERIGALIRTAVLGEDL